MTLVNELGFTRHIGRQYSPEFGQAGAKVGQTVNARKPPKYMGGYGNGLHLEDIQEIPVPITVDQLFGVHFSANDVDFKLKMDLFRSRYVEPAVARIANEIDRTGLQLYKQVYNTVGVPGTVPNAGLTYLNAGVYLDNTGTPRRGRNTRTAVVGSQMQATLVNALSGLFNSQSAIRAQYDDGVMGHALGLNFEMDQNIDTHVVGALGGTPLVNGANQTGSSIITNGWTASISNILRQGDILTFGTDVYGVKVQTASEDGAVSTGVLQQFVVTEDVDSDGDGAATIPISPSITTSGAFQTVTKSPDDDDVVLIFGHASSYAAAVTPTGLAFHKDFATLVTVDLEPVRGVDMAGRISDDELGLAMRLVRAYDVNTNSRPTRLEMLYGWSILYPEMACRIQS